jgi:hypothetical protein
MTKTKVITTQRHERIMLHYMLLTKQMTKLSDTLLHIVRLNKRATGEKRKVLFNGFRAYAQTELADVIMQVRRLCDILGLSYEDTQRMSLTRDQEKKEGFRRKYPNEPWI